MSWQPWVDNLMAYPPLNVAAIYGLDGSLWAKSEGFAATDAEISALIAGLKQSSGATFPSFTFQGMKFITLRMMEGEVDAKSQQHVISVVKSSQAVVIGAYIDAAGKGPVEAANQKVNVAVSRVKDALTKSGY